MVKVLDLICCFPDLLICPHKKRSVSAWTGRCKPSKPKVTAADSTL